MHLHVTALANDQAAERARELARARHAGAYAVARPTTRMSDRLRRTAARGLLVLSVASARAVRRLDACIAEDLARPFAPTDGG
jgi:hypothetical protein